MGNRKGTTNNPTHGANLTPFDSERARAAALKSAQVRRERAAAKRAAEAAASRDLDEWVTTYQREQLGPACAAAAQKIAHKILSGEIDDPRSLVSALPVLVDIARLEAGLNTTATMHVTATLDPMARIRELRARAAGEVITHATPLALQSGNEAVGVSETQTHS